MMVGVRPGATPDFLIFQSWRVPTGRIAIASMRVSAS
jgi:hypothetical protein